MAGPHHPPRPGPREVLKAMVDVATGFDLDLVEAQVSRPVVRTSDEGEGWATYEPGPRLVFTVEVEGVD